MLRPFQTTYRLQNMHEILLPFCTGKYVLNICVHTTFFARTCYVLVLQNMMIIGFAMSTLLVLIFFLLLIF